MFKINWKGLTNVIGGTVLMLWTGTSFLWSNITIYVLSYFFHMYESDETLVAGQHWSTFKHEAMEEYYK